MSESRNILSRSKWDEPIDRDVGMCNGEVETLKERGNGGNVA